MNDLSVMRLKDLIASGIVKNRPTAERWMKLGDFPKKVRLGPRTVGWRRSDIEAWLESRTWPRTRPHASHASLPLMIVRMYHTRKGGSLSPPSKRLDFSPPSKYFDFGDLEYVCEEELRKELALA